MKHTKIYLALILLCSLTQCKDISEDLTIIATNELEHALYSGGTFEDVPPRKESSTKHPDSLYTENGKKWKCTRTTYDIKDGLGGNGGFAMFNPNADVVYPGNMLQGNSLRNATPDVIAVERAGGTISYNIIDGNINSAFTVDKVTKSSITQAMNAIVAGNEVMPANFNFSLTHLQSRQQFAMEVKADFENSFLELEGQFAMETDNSYQSFLVRLDQQFYTMSFDIPTDKSQLFAPSVTAEQLSKYVGSGNPATYISSVTYGRIYYLLIESTSSALAAESAIRSSFSAIEASGSGSVDASYVQNLSNLKVKMFAYGGEAGGTLKTSGSLDLGSLSTKLAETGDIRSGQPLSYVVRSAYDNKVVAMPVATKYDIVKCELVGEDNTPPASTAQWTGLLTKLGGPVGAIMTRNNGKRVIINKAGTHYVNEANGVVSSTLYPISSMFAGTVPFDSLGAAAQINFFRSVSGFPMMYIGEVLWNKEGNQYVNVNLSTDKCGPVNSIGDFIDKNCPFNSQGIGAMCSYTFEKVIAFNKSGTKYSIYAYNGGWGKIIDISNFGGKGNFPFSAVSAATQFKIGQRNYIALFNEAGTQYCIFDETLADISPIYDL